MTMMRTSRKGTKMNDSRHFQYHPPHIRKKMPLLRVIPKNLISSSSKRLGFPSVASSSLKNPEKIVSNQRSEEVATFLYTDGQNSNNSVYSGETQTQDREIQTESEPQPSQIAQPNRSEETLENLGNLPLKTGEDTLRPEDTRKPQITSILEFSPARTISPKVEFDSKPNPDTFVAVKETRVSSTCIGDNDSKKNSWWRSIFKQFIVDFFLQLLGRDASRKKSTESIDEKQYSVVATTKDRAQRSSKSERNDSRKCRTKKCENSYEATQHKRRVRRSKRDEVIFDLIRLTQDENLRATILEQALRTRVLEEENARFRKKLDEKLKTRQRSSPFY